MAKVTMFTSCFNQADHLAQAIESVLAQTFPYFEYLLYDDGSTDDTWKVMQSYAEQDERIKATKLKKQFSISSVQNMSISEGTGEFWSWCPSDDILKPDSLQVNYDLSCRLGHTAVLYADADIINAHGKIVGKGHRPSLSYKEVSSKVWKTSVIPFTGIWIPMHFFKTFGGFPEHLDYSEDFWWAVKTAGVHNVPFHHVAQILHQKRIHGNRLSARNGRDLPKRMKEVWDELRKYQEGLQNA